MRISDWSSDVCSSDLTGVAGAQARRDTQVLLDRRHVAFDVIAHLETVGLEVLDRVLAAAAVGIAVHIDDIRGVGHAGHQQSGECGEVEFHGLLQSDVQLQPQPHPVLRGVGAGESVVTSAGYPASSSAATSSALSAVPSIRAGPAAAPPPAPPTT